MPDVCLSPRQQNKKHYVFRACVSPEKRPPRTTNTIAKCLNANPKVRFVLPLPHAAEKSTWLLNFFSLSELLFSLKQSPQMALLPESGGGGGDLGPLKVG